MTRKFKNLCICIWINIFYFPIFHYYVNGMNNQQDEFRVGMEVNYAPFNWVKNMTTMVR